MTYYEFCKYMQSKGYSHVKMYPNRADVWERDGVQITTPVYDKIPLSIVRKYK